MADIVQLSTRLCGTGSQSGIIGKLHVQTAGQIQSGLARRQQIILPMRWDMATGVDGSDNNRLRSSVHGLLIGHFGNRQRCRAPRQTVLADAKLRTPFENTAGCLRRQRILRVTEEQQIGRGDLVCG
jgi:hypothetical protein